MSRRSDEELQARNGHTLMVLIVCRISGCASQKELSNQDQEDNAKEVIADLYRGKTAFHVISTTGKGEALDRPELVEIEEAYKSCKYDVVVYDDLSRLIRGGNAERLLGLGVDHGTRSICVHDGIDTADGTWQEDALNACSENVAHNERCSKRIKQKSMNRFKKFGQPTGRPIMGYVVPPGKKSYDDWQKEERWVPVIHEGAKLLKQTLDCATVADYFNEQAFPVGPYARRNQWNGPMVRKYYGNTLLKGKPQRGAKHTVKRHETGRRVSVTNPKGPTYYSAPHLAYFPEEEFDSLNALLAAKNVARGRKKVNGVDPLLRKSRKDSRFPGVHARCWYCGFHDVWGANGMTENLMCSNSREWHCWHSIGFPGPKAAEMMVAEIRGALAKLDHSREMFTAQLEINGLDVAGEFAAEQQKLSQEKELLIVQKANLVAAIKAVGAPQFVLDEIQAIKIKESELLLRLNQLEHHPDRLVLPESYLVLRELLEEQLQRLSIDSYEFAEFMRKLVPAMHLYTVRLCDGGHLLPRAKVQLNLGGLFPDVNLVPGLRQLLIHDVTLDLFDPPQRERIRVEAVRHASTGLKAKAIAGKIKEEPAPAAVDNALELHRTMLSRGLDNPYVVVLAPPDDYSKLRRHKHPRYQFQALDGYVRPAL